MDLFATTAEGKPAIGGEFIFTGATIYYLYYAEVSIRESENGNGRKHGRTDGNTGQGTAKKKSKEYTRREEKSGKYELLAPQTWPKWSNDNEKKKGAGFEKLDI